MKNLKNFKPENVLSFCLTILLIIVIVLQSKTQDPQYYHEPIPRDQNSNILIKPLNKNKETVCTYSYGDIIFIQGNRVCTESGIFDETFKTRKDALNYFEDISVYYIQDAYNLIDSYEHIIDSLENELNLKTAIINDYINYWRLSEGIDEPFGTYIDFENNVHPIESIKKKD